jgi:hypothetical protein
MLINELTLKLGGCSKVPQECVTNTLSASMPNSYSFIGLLIVQDELNEVHRVPFRFLHLLVGVCERAG